MNAKSETAHLPLSGIVVLDLTMPGRTPLEALGELSRTNPGVRTIVFTGHDDPSTITAAADAGAWGLVSKMGEPGDLIKAVRRVAAGEACFPA